MKYILSLMMIITTLSYSKNATEPISIKKEKQEESSSLMASYSTELSITAAFIAGVIAANYKSIKKFINRSPVDTVRGEFIFIKKSDVDLDEFQHLNEVLGTRMHVTKCALHRKNYSLSKRMKTGW